MSGRAAFSCLFVIALASAAALATRARGDDAVADAAPEVPMTTLPVTLLDGRGHPILGATFTAVLVADEERVKIEGAPAARAARRSSASPA